MHDSFADWYRLVSVDPHQIDLAKRWRGIETFIKKVDKIKILEIVKQFFGDPFQSSDSETNFRNAFKKVDNTFPMRGNDLEMQVLAGSTIAHLLMSGEPDLADTVALAVVCLNFQGLRKKLALNEIVELAETYLLERSNNLRTDLTTPSVSKVSTTVPPLEIAITPLSAASQVVKSAQPTIDALKELPNKLVPGINEAFISLSRQLLLQQEESNMLWWLFSAHSRDIKKRISDIDVDAASLIVGKELSDLTFVLPGPVATEAFLNKMLNSDDKKVTVDQAISSATISSWKIQVSKTPKLDSLPEFCTINYAIKQSVELENSNEWATKFTKHSGIKTTDELSPTTLALQMYRERLLIKAVQ